MVFKGSSSFIDGFFQSNNRFLKQTDKYEFSKDLRSSKHGYCLKDQHSFRCRFFRPHRDPNIAFFFGVFFQGIEDNCKCIFLKTKELLYCIFKAPIDFLSSGPSMDFSKDLRSCNSGFVKRPNKALNIHLF